MCINCCTLQLLFMLILFKAQQTVEKLRCILPLPNLFPSLARRFSFHSAPFGLTALTALHGVLLKNRRLVKVNLEVPLLPKSWNNQYKGYKRSARRQFVWPVCRAYGPGRRASVKDCKICLLKGK